MFQILHLVVFKWHSSEGVNNGHFLFLFTLQKVVLLLARTALTHTFRFTNCSETAGEASTPDDIHGRWFSSLCGGCGSRVSAEEQQFSRHGGYCGPESPLQVLIELAVNHFCQIWNHGGWSAKVAWMVSALYIGSRDLRFKPQFGLQFSHAVFDANSKG